MELTPNEGKKVIIEVDGVKYERLLIKTHLITDKTILRCCQAVRLSRSEPAR